MNNPLVVCALKDELKIESSKIDLLYTGVGKINAAISITKYLSKRTIPEYVINFGTAGSKIIPVGEMVDCTKFIQRDMDVSGLGFMKSQTPFEPLVPIILDSSHVTFNPIGMNETCATGDSFVQEETDYVVDMEAYALAKVCWKRNVDFISFKYITDNANEDSPKDWEEHLSDGIVKFKERIIDEFER